jgi:hypothetical protein
MRLSVRAIPYDFYLRLSNGTGEEQVDVSIPSFVVVVHIISQCSTSLGMYGASTSSVIGVKKYCVHMVPAGSQWRSNHAFVTYIG